MSGAESWRSRTARSSFSAPFGSPLMIGYNEDPVLNPSSSKVAKMGAFAVQVDCFINNPSISSSDTRGGALHIRIENCKNEGRSPTVLLAIKDVYPQEVSVVLKSNIAISEGTEGSQKPHKVLGEDLTEQEGTFTFAKSFKSGRKLIVPFTLKASQDTSSIPNIDLGLQLCMEDKDQSHESRWRAYSVRDKIMAHMTLLTGELVRFIFLKIP
ncbi:hypothetical protein T439DRAFT_141870 [Meredithblackwellia eburnea MCA 4105]